MIARIKNRIDMQAQPTEQTVKQTQDGEEQDGKLSDELIFQMRKFAVAQPVVVVAAGLAIGVLTGFILKRK